MKEEGGRTNIHSEILLHSMVDTDPAWVISGPFYITAALPGKLQAQQALVVAFVAELKALRLREAWVPLHPWIPKIL